MGSKAKVLKWKYKGTNRIWFYITAIKSDDHMTGEGGEELTQWELRLDDDNGDTYHTFRWFEGEPTLSDCLVAIHYDISKTIIDFGIYGKQE